MASRRSRKKSKQRRHQAPKSKGEQGVVVDISSKPDAGVSSGGSAKKRITSASPLTSAGVLDWNSVKLPFPEPPAQKDPAPMTRHDMPSPVASVAIAVMCAMGIVMTGRWSLVLLAVLGAVMLIDPRVRANRDLLLRIAAAVVLCAVCMPLVNQATADLSFKDQGLIGGGVVVLFAAALWMIGGVSRRVARLQDSLFRQGGLYSIGLACQILSVVVLLLDLVLLFLLFVSLS